VDIRELPGLLADLGGLHDMTLVSAGLASVTFALAVVCVSLFVRRKDRSALVMALVSLVACVDVLLASGSLLPVALPITAATLVTAWVMVRRQRKVSHK
jgi:hypothetical protein